MIQKPVTVAVNDFVRRQIKGSGKTYSPTMSFEEIANVAQEHLHNGNYREGYRDGVRIISVRSEFNQSFVCPFIKLEKSSILNATVVKRRPEEEPYIQIRATKGKPLLTGKVELILYRHDVLAENKEHSTEEDWELISMHALPKGVEKLPMGPVTMMRNQLELAGGTKAHYSSEEWAEAVRFWQQYAALEI
ncbi:MAG: DUF3228 family protein [Candidatus Marinimicrobia bacterium]|jgi:hypothetical protein|nr:DUF3228 family protein [Candidatus Neomarinimicrobiota bacterium]MBT3617461.1 DUF3228 family protein [Candidatus Neomarinimicrobiota bacterium]MBT3829401.1 DUF3228 family protein [Candidatus Neomarinimicrobiota bacterium]MBT3997684.1 DUF3228 family protein [Candidatus Neomarinimicrobiota bacterium]MBT4280982.1 DUF3228 family protein [Candidatus Neomarinimicrobiota bacterium]